MFVLASLIIPFFLSLSTYLRYNRLAQQDYANATIRKIETKTEALKIFGRCYVAVTYEYTHANAIYQSQDNLNCSYKDKVFAGNTVPVYFDPHNPKASVSQFGLAINSQQLLDNIYNGLLGTILLIGIGWLYYASNRKDNAPHLKYI